MGHTLWLTVVPHLLCAFGSAMSGQARSGRYAGDVTAERTAAC